MTNFNYLNKRNILITISSLLVVAFGWMAVTTYNKSKIKVAPLSYEQQINKIETQSQSDSVDSIEKDVNETNMDSVDTEVNNIEMELNTSY